MILSKGGRRAWPGGVHGCWGHAWLLVGGMHGCGGVRGCWGDMCGCWGVCMVVGDVCGCGGHVWLLGASMVAGGACVGYDAIRSISGRYASYWNAFLFYFNFMFNFSCKSMGTHFFITTFQSSIQIYFLTKLKIFSLADIPSKL